MNTYTSGRQGEPVVVSDGSSGFVAIWSSGSIEGGIFGGNQDGSESGIFGQRYDSAGGALGGEFQVNTYTIGEQSHPAAAMRADGELVVVWSSENQDGNDFGVFGQLYDSAGGALGGEFQVNTYASGPQYFPAVATEGTGGFVVTWDGRGTSDSFGISGRRYDSAGSPLGSQFQVNDYVTGFQFDSSVAPDGSGGFVVAWSSQDQDGSSYGIQARRFDDAGAPLGGEFAVNSYTTGAQLEARLAPDPRGGFLAVWMDGRPPRGDQPGEDGQDGDLSGIFAQRYDSAGGALGSEFQVNTFASGAQYDPAAIVDKHGGFVVTWAGEGSGDSDAGVFAQRFDNEAAFVGPPFQVNGYTTGVQDLPAVSRDGSGGYVVAWQSRFQDGSEEGVFAQRFVEVPLECECVVTRIQTPGGSFVARLRNTSPDLFGSGSEATKAIRVLTRLAGLTCPPSVETTLTLDVTDQDGDPVINGQAVSVPITCHLDSTTRTSFSVTYTALNCPGDSGPAPGSENEIGMITVETTTAATPSTIESTTISDEQILCKPS